MGTQSIPRCAHKTSQYIKPNQFQFLIFNSNSKHHKSNKSLFLILNLNSNSRHQKSSTYIPTKKTSIHMTGTMTNPMSVDLRLWMEGRLTICPCLTFVRFITLLLLYILNCSTFLWSKLFILWFWCSIKFQSSIDSWALDLLKNLFQTPPL